jgi:hypothetical protein
MRSETLLALGVVILILAALVAKSVLLSVPPVRTNNAPDQFDAVRAKARLAYILGDQRPHPADSVGDDLVRARLVTTLQQMGLKPIIRDQFACNDFQKTRLVACARVQNVIATLGPTPGKALLLSAHYDSVPVGPGAADDGIGVATLLEVGSLLKDRPLKRPIILLFNEGEELGLIGARAFLADPLSQNVDSLLNFEARGVTGPVTMFETNEPNGAAITAYADVVRRPFASSLSTDVARLIPNDTDVTVYKERGWLTLNSAITGNETHYHSPGDDLASLDLRSLQSMGDEALALTSKLSAGGSPAQGNRIFFDLLGQLFVHMPLALGVGCLLILLAAFAGIAWKREALLGGSAVVLGSLVAGGVSAWLTISIMGHLREGIYWRAHPEIAFTAIYATTLLGALAVLRTVGAKVETPRLRAAYWFLFLLLGSALALIAPGGIIYFLIPPTIVLLGVAAGRWNPRAGAAAALLGVLVLYLTWGKLLAALEVLFSPGPLWIVAPVAAIVITPILIEARGLFARASRRPLLIGSGAVALLAWSLAGTAPAYSADRQQRFTIEHVSEFPSGRTYWSVLNDGTRLPEAIERMAKWYGGKLPFSDRMRALAPASPVAGIQAPALQPLEIVRNGNERTVRLRIRANGAERIALIAPPEAHIRSAGVNGMVRSYANDESGGKFTITCTGRSCDGSELTIRLDSPKPVPVALVGARNGLPVSAAPLVRLRPKFARPQYTPDETIAFTKLNL